MLASTRLIEESVKGDVSSSNGLFAGHLTIRLDSMLQTVQLPARIAHLGTSLADVQRYTLALQRGKQQCAEVTFADTRCTSMQDLQHVNHVLLNMQES